MSSVDNRIVNMKFNNSAFQSGVSKTMSSLDKLKKALTFSGSKKGLDELQNSASRFSMGSMGTTIEGVSKKFLALGTVAITAIANITSKAVDAGLQMAKSLTIDPIIQGYKEYETQLGSIQTILANTGLSGKKGLERVNGALTALNTYSDKTIYNFTEMAKNIGTFTAAGVKLKPATDAIKGIANLAALSGSTSEQASTAMYQLSQAIAANKVGLQDWNSVVNAGMGGKVFQEALFNTAKQMKTIKGVGMGTTFDQWTKAGNSFRGSLQDGWVTGEVLTNTLSTFTGDLTDAQLKAMGYNAQQIKSIQKQAQVAADAATKVKTITQLMDTLREAVGSGWAKTFSIVFGNFNEAKELWTSVSDTLGGFIQKSADMRNNVLTDWKALGGRTVLIDAIKNAFTALGSILKPIKDAFRDIFPRQTGKDLYDLTVRFKNFVDGLKIGSDTAENLRRTFRGVFAVFDIIGQVIKGVFSVFGDLFSAIGQGTGSVTEFTGGIGDFLVKLDETLKKGDGLTNFFDGLGAVLSVPIKVLGAIKDVIISLFTGFSSNDATKVSDGIGGVNDQLSTMSDIGDKVKGIFAGISKALAPIGQAISDAFGNIGNSLAGSLKGVSFDQVMSVIQTGLFAGVILLLKKFVSNMKEITDIGGGLLDSIKGPFDALTGSMQAMQKQIQAKTLLLIASAIGILTASVVALSFINAEKLKSSLTAMAVGFGELLGSMKILMTMGTVGFAKLPFIAGSLVLLSGAIALLTGAVVNIARLSWDELKRGLTGVGALLLMLTIAVKPIAAQSSGMIQAGVGISAIAIAMNILYLAVKNFSTLSWGELIKGLVAVAGSLVVISGAMRIMPSGMLAQGAGILAISVALNALYRAVKGFGELNWTVMGKGMLGIAGALTLIIVALKLMPKGMILQAVALTLISAALMGMGKAVGMMGSLPWGDIGKGLVTIAGTLALLAAAMYVMEGALPGAAALIVGAGALRILAPVIISLSKLSWMGIVKGMVALAATFAILAAAAILIGPVTPELLALGVAVALLGIGIGAAAAGLGLLVIGLAALAGAGAAGIALLLATLDDIIMKIPELAKSVAEALFVILDLIAKNGPTIVRAIGTILESLLQAITNNLPKFGEMFDKLILTLLNAIITNVPKIVEGLVTLLVALLDKLAEGIPKFIKAAVDLVVAFLVGLGKELPRIIDAGAQMIIDFLNGIADTIEKREPQIMKAGVRIGWAIVHGFWQGMSDIAGWLWGKVSKFFSNLWDKIKGWFGIHSPSTKAAQIGIDIIKGLWSGISDLAGWIRDKVIDFFSNMWDRVKNFFGVAGSVAKKAITLGVNIIKGLWNGISGLAGWVRDKVVSFFSNLWNRVTDFFGAGARKAIELGKNIVQGLWDGISSLASWIKDKVSGFVSGMWSKITGGLDKAKDFGIKIVKGIWSGITSLGSWIKEQITNFLSGLATGLADMGSSLLSKAADFGKKIVSTLNPMNWGCPTREFGQILAEGFIIGLDMKEQDVVNKADNLGIKTVKTMQQTMSKVADTMASSVDYNPTITPILDLSDVSKNASELNDMFSATATVSYKKATSISSERQQAAQTAVTEPSQNGSLTLNFNQENHSPKSLSTIEIYRMTKNQLGQARRTYVGTQP